MNQMPDSFVCDNYRGFKKTSAKLSPLWNCQRQVRTDSLFWTEENGTRKTKKNKLLLCNSGNLWPMNSEQKYHSREGEREGMEGGGKENTVITRDTGRTGLIGPSVCPINWYLVASGHPEILTVKAWRVMRCQWKCVPYPIYWRTHCTVKSYLWSDSRHAIKSQIHLYVDFGITHFIILISHDWSSI